MFYVLTMMMLVSTPNMAMLALAVVATAVGSFHDASSTTSVVPVAMSMPMSMAVARISQDTPRLLEEHCHKHN